MIKSSSAPAAPTIAPTESAIRDYAFNLYEQSGCAPGRDLDNWHEAAYCLQAQVDEAALVSQSEPRPRFADLEPGRVHAAVGHGRSVEEKTAHTSGHRNS